LIALADKDQETACEPRRAASMRSEIVQTSSAQNRA